MNENLCFRLFVAKNVRIVASTKPDARNENTRDLCGAKARVLQVSTGEAR